MKKHIFLSKLPAAKLFMLQLQDFFKENKKCLMLVWPEGSSEGRVWTRSADPQRSSQEL